MRTRSGSGMRGRPWCCRWANEAARPAWAGCAGRRGGAGGGARPAGGRRRGRWGVDAGQLHCQPGLPLRGVRAGPAGMALIGFRQGREQPSAAIVRPVMDHKAFLASVPAELRERMVERSTGRGCGIWRQDIWGLILRGAGADRGGGAGVVAAQDFAGAGGADHLPLHVLEHEATHRTPFRTVWLNDWAGRLAGFLLLLPFEWFRAFHLAHHRWTNLPGKDPELRGRSPRPGGRGSGMSRACPTGGRRSGCWQRWSGAA
jgi:hypothetical protein